MCALEALRDGLRRRDVYVARSERYGDPRASLLDAPTWNASRADVCRSLSLPETPEPFIKRLGAELDAAYRRTIEGLHTDDPIHELATGAFPVEQLDALPESAAHRVDLDAERGPERARQLGGDDGAQLDH